MSAMSIEPYYVLNLFMYLGSNSTNLNTTHTMKPFSYLTVLLILLCTGCSNDEPLTLTGETPVVKAEAFYTVLSEENITYAVGLAHTNTSASAFSIPLKLDIYYPDNKLGNRPVYMFIHGGGFRGGTKTKPEIVSMANFYASRGWVFISIDYRTTEELGVIQGMTQAEVLTYYKGLAPHEWVNHALQAAENADQVQQATAMYLAQRDAKAALRWIVANASTYNVSKDFITVGGASAGAITTVALGISNQEDFRDEISLSDDPTLSTTNLSESYEVKSMVYFWGSNIKLDVFEAVYDLIPYSSYDSSDPELFMGHGTATDLVTPYEEALELQSIYNSLGVYNTLVTLLQPNGEPAGHGAWNAVVNGKDLSELTFDFLVERQQLTVN